MFSNNLKMNKKGTDKMLSIYWFTILFIVAAAVVFMVSMYFTPSDIREIESNLLTNRVADCLINQGGLKEGITSENFLVECDLNFNVEDVFNWDDDQYFVEIKFYDFLTQTAKETIRVGNLNFEKSCGDPGKLVPVCNERNLFAVDNSGAQYLIKIKTIVRKTEKNVA